MTTRPNEPNKRVAPSGSTIADLLVLIFGAGLAVALEWYSGTLPSSTIAGWPAPGWYVTGNQVIETCQKGCIALIPLVVFRHWRYGGAIRPAEALPIFIGLPQVLFALSKWRGLGIYHFDPLVPRSMLVNPEVLSLWLISEIMLGVLAAALVVSRRRLSPDLITGLLFIFAYSRITETGGFFFQQWANEQIVLTSQSPSTQILRSTFLVQGPLMTLQFVPLAAAVLDFGRRPLAGRSWVEWAGMLLGASTLVLIQTRIVVMQYLGPPSRFAFAKETHLAMVVIALVASFILVRGFGPPLRDFLFKAGSDNQTIP